MFTREKWNLENIGIDFIKTKKSFTKIKMTNFVNDFSFLIKKIQKYMN